MRPAAAHRVVLALLAHAIETRRQGQLAVLLVLEHGVTTMNGQIADGQPMIWFRGTIEPTRSSASWVWRAL
jgi:hypothetical protein